MRRFIAILFTMALFLSLNASELSFSGGRSSLSLREGKEEVILSDGAKVSVDSISITSDKITLSGSGWRYVECEGTTTIKDEERGLEIVTRSLWFDREEERILISGWFEVSDTQTEVTATGSYLEFDMKSEKLQLDKQITLLKLTEDGIMRCSAESVLFDRANDKLSLMGNAKVIWDGNEYSAEAISVDLETDSISLDGRIKGNING